MNSSHREPSPNLSVQAFSLYWLGETAIRRYSKSSKRCRPRTHWIAVATATKSESAAATANSPRQIRLADLRLMFIRLGLYRIVPIGDQLPE